MPAAFHINQDEGLVTIQVEGEVDLVDLFEVARSLYEDSEYDPTLPLLVDLRGMQLALESDALKPFNRYVIPRFGRERTASIAIVVDQDMHKDLCAAVYWLSCAIDGSELFEDYDHALKWLIKREFAKVL